MVVRIVDYGMGNLHSVASAFRHLGCEASVTSSPDDLKGAEPIVLPGVGSFRRAMTQLNRDGLTSALRAAVLDDGASILGICLGMQLLGEHGVEDGGSAGLGFVRGTVTRMRTNLEPDAKIPHIGFTTLEGCSGSLFEGLPSEFDAYFNHGFCFEQIGDARVTSRSRHGQDFVASFETDMRVFGTQFHPENSQAFGLRILENFLKVA